MKPEYIHGDLFSQSVEVIVNPWNRNIIPWWLLLPQGVSGALKERAGYAPFKEIARYGVIPLGEARITGAGKLAYKAFIHVAGINMFWFATQYSIRASVRSAMRLAEDADFKSIAFPLIGAGSGNRGREFSRRNMLEAFELVDSHIQVKIVEFRE